MALEKGHRILIQVGTVALALDARMMDLDDNIVACEYMPCI